MKRLKAITLVVGIAAIVMLCAGMTDCTGAKSASVAVNRYYESLKHVQQAEIAVHEAKKIEDGQHVTIQKAIKLASQAGRKLDTAIALAAQGADYEAYIDEANKTFDEAIALVKPLNANDLTLAVDTATSLLKNAISSIRAIKAQTQGQPAPAKPSPGLAFWLAFPVLGLAAGAGAGGLALGAAVLQWLGLAVQLEPYAFDLALKFATSLKGKTLEEVQALNLKLADDIEATADAEIAKYDKPQG